jgi:hypothetical protein
MNGHPNLKVLPVALLTGKSEQQISRCIELTFDQSPRVGFVYRDPFKYPMTVKKYSCYRQFVKIRGCHHCMTLRVLFSVALIISLISCQSSRQDLTRPIEKSNLSGILMIPGWYAEQPNVNGCRFAYGYSGIYLDQKCQKEMLVKSGAANMAKNQKVFIKAAWAGTQTHSQSLTASYVIENGWQDRASQLEKHLQIVHEYRLGSGVIALCAICPDGSLLQQMINKIDNRLVDINSDEPPEWVKEPKSPAEYVYGIGTAPSYIKPGEAWQEAERQARADLAFKLSARYNVLQKTSSKNTGSMSQNLSETTAEVVLTGAAICRHAYSHAGKCFYALARMPTPAR